MMFNIDISDRTYIELVGVLGGLFTAVYGNGKRAQFSKLLKNGIRVEGEVVEIKTRHWSSDAESIQEMYYPVIHFETIDSGTVAGDYELLSSNPPAYKLWEKVNVIYDPADYKNFMVDNVSTRLFGFVILVLGVAAVLAAIIFTFSTRTATSVFNSLLEVCVVAFY
jgi:hypothetical protein